MAELSAVSFEIATPLLRFYTKEVSHKYGKMCVQVASLLY